MRLLFSILFFILVIISYSFIVNPDNGRDAPLSKQKNGNFTDPKLELPLGYNELFAASGECKLCHNSMTNAQGELVSIVADWRSSMMANASKDPFWRAKVSHETTINPSHTEVLEDVCTKCHAPIGRFNAHYLGQSFYSIAEMEGDPLALDGVSCTVCHQITSASLGNYSGNILFGEDKIIWGPYLNPFANPMINFTGYTPAYGNHIRNSELCASCHTLLTNPVDLNGIPTGTEFVEQAIFHEWKNSGYPATETTCQTCHIPEITDTVKISTLPPWLGGRSPFGMHQLAGANVFMLKLLKQNLDEIGVTADEVQMDSTISRAERMLKQNSLNLQLEEILRTNDSLFINVSLENKAGHKFPSGYPSRRAFIELLVTGEANDTVFHSGRLDSNYNLIEEDEGFESHYNVINDESQVQIYEMVMGDVNYEPTTILERAFIHLKDNRIPPSGFTTYNISYDTVKIVGDAFTDNDFNKENSIEGTGKDIVHYHIPLEGNGDDLIIKVKVHYQTVSNKWLTNIFSYSTSEIDTFKEYYNAANIETVIVNEASILSTITTTGFNSEGPFRFFPNPAREHLYIETPQTISNVCFYDLSGRKVDPFNNNLCGTSDHLLKLSTPLKKGIYLLVLTTVSGKVYSDKILVN